MSEPLAFMITWTSYGTWLPGDQRGWVTSKEPGIQEPDPSRESYARRTMQSDAIILSNKQRHIVDSTIREHCKIRKWSLHALNVRSNHVHIVITADVLPEVVMNQLKAWCSRRLNQSDEHTKNSIRKRKWWTEHGSTKWINDEYYLETAIRYVHEGQ